MKPYRSIRWQLLVWQMFLLTVVLITLLSLHYHLQRKSLIAEVDATLQNVLMGAVPAVTPPSSPPRGGPPRGRPQRDLPRHDRPPRETMEFEALRQDRSESEEPPTRELDDDVLTEIERNKIYLAAWNPGGILMHQAGEVPPLSFNTYSGFKSIQHFTMRNGYRELISPHPTGILIVVGQSMAEIERQMATTRNQLLLVGFTVFLVALAGGWLIIRKALRPIREISRTAEEIAGGDHSRRIELSDAPEELAGLSQTLNTSFDHLDNALENQKRFSADASHELRTPIAVVLAQAQAALKRDRSIEEYKTVLEACQRAGLRLKAMADDLLDLTRIDGNEIVLIKEQQDLNDILSLAASEASHLSDRHSVDCQGTDTPLIAEIDPDRIHQISSNLLSNAIRHNPDGCAIHISLKQDGNNALIIISDEGIGIPDDALPHIFDRFYRVDKSRSREQGGTGLGLSIVKSLVEAHGGSIEAISTPGKGTSFTIRLPIK